MRGRKVSVVVDQDVFDWAAKEAHRKGMTLSQELRWLLRDGLVHHLELARQYRALAVEEAKYGR